MERETGMEPATSSLGSWSSNAELLPPSVLILSVIETSVNLERAVAEGALSPMESRSLDFVARSRGSRSNFARDDSGFLIRWLIADS